MMGPEQVTDLRLVRAADTMNQRQARAARIEALGVDRSRLDGISVPRWCPEADAGEQRWAHARAKATAAERVEAWRIFMAMPLPKKDKQPWWT